MSPTPDARPAPRMIGPEFRAWYESRGLTQTEVAALLGLPAASGQTTVSRWSRGHTPVPERVAAHLATLERLERYEPLQRS